MRQSRLGGRNNFALRAVLLSVLSTSALRAQCPDGSPPPCRTVAGLARRPAALIDQHVWVVVPFANVTRAQDLDWLRDASVNLLSLDLGRWTDISVVDDKRVADLLRDDPPARAGQPLTLNDGLALARRAGAGNLVMGDFIKVGHTTRFVATVIDVRSGNKVRSVEQQTANEDSLLLAFTPLARGVLAVPPPPDARLGSLGTSRTDAYREYLLGVNALNRFDIGEAERHLTAALALDPKFALAHFKLSVALGWREDSPRDEGAERTHAAAAAQLGTALPPRERALIGGQLAFVNKDYAKACTFYDGLVARDSGDVEALYGVGECNFHNDVVVASPTDTSARSFAGSYPRSLRAMRRVLQLDPTFHLAFQHILDIYTTQHRAGCYSSPANGACVQYGSYLLREGDSLVATPYPLTDRSRTAAQRQEQERQRAFAANLHDARTVAEEWFDTDTTFDGARYSVFQVALRQGDLPSAYNHTRALGTERPYGRRPDVVWARVTLALELGHGAEAKAALTSAQPLLPADKRTGIEAATALAFGKLGPWRTERARFAATQGQAAASWRYDLGLVMLGLTPDSLVAHERALFDASASPTCDVNCQRIAIWQSLAFGSRIPRPSWPPFPNVVIDQRMLIPQAMAAGDTALLRRNTRILDSTTRAAHDNEAAETRAYGVLAVDGYLALGDSANALKAARFFTETAMTTMAWSADFGKIPADAPALYVRMMLQRADLEIALGTRVEARKWYARVADLWADADPELQPILKRVRAALAGAAQGTKAP